MPSHAEKRVLPYSAEQLFDLVVDIERYPDFLPWCIAARNRRREGNVVWSDLVIGFKFIRERFTSRVTMTRPERIDVEYVDGPLKYLKNHWVFVPLPDGRCEIDFYVDFEFRSLVLQKLIGVLFHEAVTRMVRAFEHRAADIYGPPGDVSAEPKPA
ncbi:MAG: type II toxin-antitoxin system RatA family toxin [Alphaproteobacteria bacterium]